jgi:hypothetical protein
MQLSLPAAAIIAGADPPHNSFASPKRKEMLDGSSPESGRQRGVGKNHNGVSRYLYTKPGSIHPDARMKDDRNGDTVRVLFVLMPHTPTDRKDRRRPAADSPRLRKANGTPPKPDDGSTEHHRKGIQRMMIGKCDRGRWMIPAA